MKTRIDKQVQIQREYYTETAKAYSNMHLNVDDEHYFALRFMEAIIDFYRITSILDVGAGTGRVADYLKIVKPNVRVISIEPVLALREEGYKLGLTREELIDGDATALNFKDGEFDLVCEFGVLHHIPKPNLAVNEMLRVSKKAIFISDSNNFGQGSYLSRTIKQIANLIGVWPLLDFIKTKGKGYTISEGDGLGYSYSVFNNYGTIKSACEKVHILNTGNSGKNPYKTASHIALLGIK